MLLGHECEPGNFRGRKQTLGRSPVAGTAAGVDPQAAEPVQPGGEWLLQPYEEIPRKELPAVRMTGELQVISRRFGCGRRARLVREQHSERRTRRGAGDRGVRIAAMRG